MPFASQASGHAQAVLFGVAGVMAAVGVVLIRTAPREKADWIFLYAGGIAQVREGQPPRVVPWAGSTRCRMSTPPARKTPIPA